MTLNKGIITNEYNETVGRYYYCGAGYAVEIYGQFRGYFSAQTLRDYIYNYLDYQIEEKGE